MAAGSPRRSGRGHVRTDGRPGHRARRRRDRGPGSGPAGAADPGGADPWHRRELATPTPSARRTTESPRVRATALSLPIPAGPRNTVLRCVFVTLAPLRRSAGRSGESAPLSPGSGRRHEPRRHGETSDDREPDSKHWCEDPRVARERHVRRPPCRGDRGGTDLPGRRLVRGDRGAGHPPGHRGPTATGLASQPSPALTRAARAASNPGDGGS